MDVLGYGPGACPPSGMTGAGPGGAAIALTTNNPAAPASHLLSGILLISFFCELFLEERVDAKNAAPSLARSSAPILTETPVVKEGKLAG